MSSKKHKNSKEPVPSASEPDNEETSLGWRGYVGLVLLAGALFNVPAILKVPATTEDWMLLIIVLCMGIGGAILLKFGIKK